MSNTPQLERRPGRAMYLQIADHYRTAITKGELSPGAKLPSAATLAAQWQVSRQTINKAMHVLRGEKLVTAEDRKATYVRQDAAYSESGQSLIRNHTGAPASDSVRILSAEIVTCPVYVADILGIEHAEAGNARVCRREALTYRDGEPYRLSVSWIGPEGYGAVPELTEPRLINGLRAIAKATGRAATEGRDYFMARHADEREARHLGIEPGDAILAGTSVWRDDQGPVEYREFVLRAGEVVHVDYPVELDLS